MYFITPVLCPPLFELHWWFRIKEQFRYGFAVITFESTTITNDAYIYIIGANFNIRIAFKMELGSTVPTGRI